MPPKRNPSAPVVGDWVQWLDRNGLPRAALVLDVRRDGTLNLEVHEYPLTVTLHESVRVGDFPGGWRRIR